MSRGTEAAPELGGSRPRAATRSSRATDARLRAAAHSSAWATAFCVYRDRVPMGPTGLNREAASRPSSSAAAACGRRGWARWYRAGQELSKLEWNEPCHPRYNDADDRGHGLLWAAASGLPQVVERLLAQGADACAARDSFGRTALMLAAARGELEVVQELISPPPPATWETSQVCRWLETAQQCNAGVLKRVTAAQLTGKMLLRIDPPGWMKLGARPRQAVELTEACALLMSEQRGTDQMKNLLHSVDQNGASALHYAAVSPSPAIVSLLLETDSSLAAVRDNDDFTPLVAAAVAPEPGASRVVELLLRTEEAATSANIGMEALANDHEAFERWLQQFEHGSVWRNGLLAMSALHAAVLAQNAQVVRVLCTHTATLGLLSLADCTGTTALGYAVALANEDVLQILLEHGAVAADSAAATELSSRESSAGNPRALVLAAAAGSTQVVHQLCRHDQGSSACDADSNGHCALQWAIAGRFLDTAIALLEHGAEATQLAEDGSSPLTWLAMPPSHTFARSAVKPDCLTFPADIATVENDRRDEGDSVVCELVEHKLAPALLKELGPDIHDVQAWLRMHLWLDADDTAWLCQPLEDQQDERPQGFCQRFAALLSKISVEHSSATRLQSFWRGHQHRQTVGAQRACACYIQSVWRGHRIRLSLAEQKEAMRVAEVAAVVIQKHARGRIARAAHEPQGEMLQSEPSSSDECTAHEQTHAGASAVLCTLVLQKVHAARAQEFIAARRALRADAATVLTTLCRRRLAYRLAAKLAVQREAEYRARFRADPVRWCTEWADDLAKADLWSVEEQSVSSYGSAGNIDEGTDVAPTENDEIEQQSAWSSVSSDGRRLLALGAVASAATSLATPEFGYDDSDDERVGQWGSARWAPEHSRDPEYVPPVAFVQAECQAFSAATGLSLSLSLSLCVCVCVCVCLILLLRNNRRLCRR